ncbi:MAG: hypothetical protein PVI78_09515 [Anaerolineales bacterium]|jgi:hypothetical protein
MKSNYHSFLVRMWASETNGGLVWRVSLENSRTGEQHSFASLEAMMVFLEALALTPSVSRGDINEESLP